MFPDPDLDSGPESGSGFRVQSPDLESGSGYWLLVIGYWLLVTGYWLLVIGY